MPLKTRLTPTLNSNMPAIQQQNALKSSADEASTPVISELPSKSQDNQTSTNAKDQFNLYTQAQQELSKVTNILPNTTNPKELDKLAKKIANLQSIINLTKPSYRLSSKEYKLHIKHIQRANLDTLVKKLPPDIGGTT